jgi:hypothetical protein
MSESVIVSSSTPVLTGWLCALCGSAANVIFAALSLILNCPSLELAVAVYRGLLTRRPLPELLFIDSYTKYIKGVLIITTQDLKKKKLILERVLRLYNTSKVSTYKITKILRRDI